MPDVKALCKLADKHGWTTRRSKKGHVLFFDPDGRLVATAAGTASDTRSLKNTLAHLRAGGFPLPKRDGRSRERKAS